MNSMQTHLLSLFAGRTCPLLPVSRTCSADAFIANPFTADAFDADAFTADAFGIDVSLLMHLMLMHLLPMVFLLVPSLDGQIKQIKC